jgi:DNA-binding transcriptional ArsR family regulator
MKQYKDITDPSLAKALAHPLRTRILGALDDRTASPSELADELGASLGVVSYHVRRLYALRFLELVKSVPRRGAVEHYYKAVAGPRITSTTWGETPTIVKQATVSAALQEIGSAVGDAAAAGGFEQAHAHLSRTPITVDQEGFDQLASELDALIGRAQKIEAESIKRLERADQLDEQRATMILMLFNSPAEEREPPANGGSRPKTARRKRGSSRSRQQQAG